MLLGLALITYLILTSQGFFDIQPISETLVYKFLTWLIITILAIWPSYGP